MKRKSRVTADITKEAHDLLRASCLKFDCSKGKLIEKMIRKFCVDVEPVKSTELVVVKPQTKRFIPPADHTVYEYMLSREVDSREEATKFCDFYESNGWKVGKNKMKCWKASVRNWLKGYKEKSGSKDILAISSDSDWHKQDQGF